MEFSIIIPVYNVEAYLESCLRSILSQTFRDFELLLIDDGSTDGSGEICDAYARQYPQQIKVFHQENSGCNRSRVRALREASGDICVFVDSDDALRQDALELLHGTFEKNGCDLVLYNASKDEIFISTYRDLPFTDGQCFTGETKKELYALMATSGKLNTLWMKAAKKQIFDFFLADYNTALDIPYGEDLYMSLPMMTYAEKITYLDKKLYFYRTRENSAVNTFHPGLHRSMKIVREELERYIEIWGIQDCYPGFYTRVVTNWIHALKRLLKNQRSIEKEETLSVLRELAQDPFFRKAYRNRIPEKLAMQDRILANLLYGEKIQLLRMIGYGLFSLKQ